MQYQFAMFNLLPYKINLKSQDKDLEELYERVSNTTEPILSLDIVKKNFDISNYVVHKALNGKSVIYLDKDNIKDIFSVEKWRDKQLNKLINN